MAVPVAGQLVRASDSLSYLDAVPRVHAYDSAGISCIEDTATLITWDTELYDSHAMHDVGVNPSRITFPVAGLFEFDVQIILPVATYAGTTSRVNTRQNAAGSSSGGTSLSNVDFNVAAAANITAGTRFTRLYAEDDYLEVFVTQNSTANRTTVAGAYSTRVFARYIASA